MGTVSALNNLSGFAHNPRGNIWLNDDSSFGHKLLKKMGWSKGKGLGKDENGIKENIKVKVKGKNSGVGWKDESFLQIQNTEYDSLLKSISDACAEEKGTLAINTEHKENKSGSLEQRSQDFKNRLHYQKLVRGKDLSNYSEKDMKSIFILNKPVEEENLSAVKLEVPDNVSNTSDIHTSQLSIAEYFDGKMRKKKGQNNWSTDVLNLKKVRKMKQMLETADFSLTDDTILDEITNGTNQKLSSTSKKHEVIQNKPYSSSQFHRKKRYTVSIDLNSTDNLIVNKIITPVSSTCTDGNVQKDAVSSPPRKRKLYTDASTDLNLAEDIIVDKIVTNCIPETYTCTDVDVQKYSTSSPPHKKKRCMTVSTCLNLTDDIIVDKIISPKTSTCADAYIQKGFVSSPPHKKKRFTAAPTDLNVTKGTSVDKIFTSCTQETSTYTDIDIQKGSVSSPPCKKKRHKSISTCQTCQSPVKPVATSLNLTEDIIVDKIITPKTSTRTDINVQKDSVSSPLFQKKKKHRHSSTDSRFTNDVTVDKIVTPEISTRTDINVQKDSVSSPLSQKKKKHRHSSTDSSFTNDVTVDKIVTPEIISTRTDINVLKHSVSSPHPKKKRHMTVSTGLNLTEDVNGNKIITAEISSCTDANVQKASLATPTSQKKKKHLHNSADSSFTNDVIVDKIIAPEISTRTYINVQKHSISSLHPKKKRHMTISTGLNLTEDVNVNKIITTETSSCTDMNVQKDSLGSLPSQKKKKHLHNSTDSSFTKDVIVDKIITPEITHSTDENVQNDFNRSPPTCKMKKNLEMLNSINSKVDEVGFNKCLQNVAGNKKEMKGNASVVKSPVKVQSKKHGKGSVEVSKSKVPNDWNATSLNKTSNPSKFLKMDSALKSCLKSKAGSYSLRVSSNKDARFQLIERCKKVESKAAASFNSSKGVTRGNNKITGRNGKNSHILKKLEKRQKERKSMQKFKKDERYKSSGKECTSMPKFKMIDRCKSGEKEHASMQKIKKMDRCKLCNRELREAAVFERNEIKPNLSFIDEYKYYCDLAGLPTRNSVYNNEWIERQKGEIGKKDYRTMYDNLMKHEVLKTSSLASIKGYGNWGLEE